MCNNWQSHQPSRHCRTESLTWKTQNQNAGQPLLIKLPINSIELIRTFPFSSGSNYSNVILYHLSGNAHFDKI